MTWCVFKVKDESVPLPFLERLVEKKACFFLHDGHNLPQLEKQGCLVLHISFSMLW